MKLLIIRHAIARDKKAFRKNNKSDDLRPLTKEGKKKMHRNVKRLRKMVPKISKVFSSPLVRATQTAEILVKAYSLKDFQEVEVMKPDASLPTFLKWLNRYKKESVVAVVGHEPHLSNLLSWLLTGKSLEFTEFKKGGACLLDFSTKGSLKKGQAKLLWLWDPTAAR